MVVATLVIVVALVLALMIFLLLFWINDHASSLAMRQVIETTKVKSHIRIPVKLVSERYFGESYIELVTERFEKPPKGGFFKALYNNSGRRIGTKSLKSPKSFRFLVTR